MLKQWYATFTRRWHTSPHLSNTVDPVGYHSGRMAVLALTLLPNWSRALLSAIAVHDLGESVTGDVPFDAKKNPALKRLLESIEETELRGMGLSYHLDAIDARRLKFLDRLDAYLWAYHHAPDMVLSRDDWMDQLEWLNDEAGELGCQLNM